MSTRSFLNPAGSFFFLFLRGCKKKKTAFPSPKKEKNKNRASFNSRFAFRSSVGGKRTRLPTCDGEMIFIKDVFFFMGKLYWILAIICWRKKHFWQENRKRMRAKNAHKLGKRAAFMNEEGAASLCPNGSGRRVGRP